MLGWNSSTAPWSNCSPNQMTTKDSAGNSKNSGMKMMGISMISRARGNVIA